MIGPPLQTVARSAGAASAPVAFADNGLPVGMQILARHHRDAELFDLGYLYEREVGWPLVAPSVVASQLAPA